MPNSCAKLNTRLTDQFQRSPPASEWHTLCDADVMIEALYQAADQTLYAAKDAGRDRLLFAVPQHGVRSLSKGTH